MTASERIREARSLRETREAELRSVRERLLNARPYGNLADERVISELTRRRDELERQLARMA